MQATKIGWTSLSANPLKYRDKATGKTVWSCVKVSPGCGACYAEKLALRWDRGKLFTAANMREVEPYLCEDELHKMLRAKRVGGVEVAGARVFCADMTDAFGEWVPDEMLDRLFAVFALRTDVTWQILTKRAERMAAYFAGLKDRVYAWDQGEGETEEFLITALHDANDIEKQLQAACAQWLDMWNARHLGWPLPNVHLGVSVESQHYANERIPNLLRTPAAVRFLSIEPMLGAVDLAPWILDTKTHGAAWREPPWSPLREPEVINGVKNWGGSDRLKLGWIIIGNESNGPRVGRLGEFKTEAEWIAGAERIVEQCRAAGVPAFVKQIPLAGKTVHDVDLFPERLRERSFPR